jgi:hypothetical protein
VCDILILGQGIVKIYMRVAAVTLISREPMLFNKNSNKRNFCRVDFKKFKCVGGP